jgi:hypothetical protein
MLAISILTVNWPSNDLQLRVIVGLCCVSMATKPKSSKPPSVRLRPIVLAYLDELDRIGGYGKGRSGVIRRFVENGIAEAIQVGVLEKKNADDFIEEREGDEEE